jgi:hypothetical protein
MNIGAVTVQSSTMLSGGALQWPVESRARVLLGGAPSATVATDVPDLPRVVLTADVEPHVNGPAMLTRLGSLAAVTVAEVQS